MNPFLQRFRCRHMGHRTRTVRRGAVSRGIVERRVHQHDVHALRCKAGRCEIFRAGGNIKHEGFGRNRIGDSVGPSEFRQPLIDLDQYQRDPGDTFGNRKARRTYAGAEVDGAIARASRRCGRQQHRIVTGAVAGFRLAQAQFATEKGVLGDVAH